MHRREHHEKIRFGRARYLAASMLLLALWVPSVAALQKIQDGYRFDLAVKESVAQLSWRAIAPTLGPVSAVTAEVGDLALDPPVVAPYPEEGSKTLVLFLVDVSDPARERTVRGIRSVIERCLERGGPQHLFGLAEFDASLRVLVEPTKDLPTLVAALGRIEAIGKTTELYRSLLDAIHFIAAIAADRKAVFVFSDGRAEDSAYSLEDVVAAARKDDIAIYGLGYAGRRSSDAVALQSLRRLADETAGRYFEATGGELPGEFYAQPFALLDTGGRASFNLAGTYRLPFGDSPPLRVRASYGERSVELSETVTLALPSGSQWRAIAGQRDNRPMVAGFAAALGLILFVGIGGTARWMTRPPPPVEVAPTPLAFLEILDSTEQSVPLYGDPVRIGRGESNDVVLANTSVSDCHAAIRLLRDGDFFVADLGSSNGLLINGTVVQDAVLHDGDIMEVGEVRIRFARQPS